MPVRPFKWKLRLFLRCYRKDEALTVLRVNPFAVFNDIGAVHERAYLHLTFHKLHLLSVLLADLYQQALRCILSKCN